ncbi:MAG: outer membrane beta-barrel protein [Alphaproteobacteria bacterium]|nr:outer membrane beta-barrel protein [Alphaproteobacteria bacterium]
MKKVMLSAAVCAMAFTANADVAEEVEVIETAQASAFNSIYAGLGIGGSFLKSGDVKYINKDLKEAKGNLKANRFIGSFVLGAGKVFSNNVYVGGEFLMDFTKNKKDGFEYININYRSLPLEKAEGKVGGYIPQLNLRLGYVFKNDVLAYAKLGCAWTKTSFKLFEKSGDDWKEIDGSGESKTKASFVLGLGAEKAFCKKFSAAVEADYNFGWKHEFEGANQDIRWNKGWNVRALVKYNVKY